MWRFEGTKTLFDYLKKGKDALTALKRDMGVSEVQVVPLVMQQLLEGLKELHANGVVHRDCKPANILWSETVRGEFISLFLFLYVFLKAC